MKNDDAHVLCVILMALQIEISMDESLCHYIFIKSSDNEKNSTMKYIN